MLRKLAASSDANLAALRAAGALGAVLELLRDAPPASCRVAGALHLLRDLALYAPADRCALDRLCEEHSGVSVLSADHEQCAHRSRSCTWSGVLCHRFLWLTPATVVACGKSVNVAVWRTDTSTLNAVKSAQACRPQH